MAHVHSELGSSFRSLTRYDEYYLAGGDLFLLVEHHVFRVHRYFFERESTYFKAKLATPASPGSTRPGTSESNAILLDDVRVHEFARFLWVFYNPKYSLYHTSVADWTAILTLAHRWAFPEVKALAVRELERQSMPDIERVVVYQDNQVDRNLLIRCYAALCEREEPLTPAEGRRMGIDTALTIAQLREMARRSPIDCRSPTSANIRGNELHSLVRELFVIAEPIRDDDSVPQTPLGGPTHLWQGLPSTAPTQSSLQSTVQPPPVKPMAQTTKPAPTPQPQPPARTATPPLSVPPVQEPETHSLDPTPLPPPLPEKPERPQLITNPALAKVNQQTETSRPSTPVPETPTTATGEKEKKKKKKVGKKEKAAAAAAATALAAETGSTEAKPDEPEAGAAVATEEAVQQQQLQEGEKGDVTQVPLVDLVKKDDTVILPEKEAGSSGGISNVIPSTDDEKEREREKEKEKEGKGREKDKAGAVTGGDGVSTDTSNTTTDPLQEVKPDHSERGPLAVQKSPLSPNKKRTEKNDFLKSPEEWSTKSPTSLVNNIWSTLTLS